MEKQENSTAKLRSELERLTEPHTELLQSIQKLNESLEMVLKEINTREEKWRTIKRRDDGLEIKYKEFKTFILPTYSASFGSKAEGRTEVEKVSNKLKEVVLVALPALTVYHANRTSKNSLCGDIAAISNRDV
ncbi:unnamed protein product [Orchesella dallaii]|uniref:Uncharacterized protein n=1 Tax=Orchesella dallaii TaxID=48710 RepID=A0ABP1QZH2_9HEXA